MTKPLPPGHVTAQMSCVAAAPYFNVPRSEKSGSRTVPQTVWESLAALLEEKNGDFEWSPRSLRSLHK
ncbi:hypothetical protein FKM82_004119 [Ascaphus truei]